MTGDLYIDNAANAWSVYPDSPTDAWLYYGVNFEDGALASLITPPALKDFAESSSRLQHGSVLIANTDTAKYDSRSVSLEFHLVYNEDAECLTDDDKAVVDGETEREREHRILMAQYKAFCSVLAQGRIVLKSKWSEDIYRMIYTSCSQLSMIVGGIMKFTLKLTEPNPNNRGSVNDETEI